MGLIKAAVGAAGGVMADQWKEFFYCESMPKEVLVTKGVKRTSGRSSNTRGSDNIITSGSGIAVADGQCMMIVDQGKIVDFCAEPGEYTYDASTEPTIFAGQIVAVTLWFEKRHRATANSLCTAGGSLGTVIAPLVIAWMARFLPWHDVFIVAGLVGLVIAVAWALIYKNPPQEVLAVTMAPDKDEVARNNGEQQRAFTWGELWTTRSLWGVLLIRLISDPVWYFCCFWLPGYLRSMGEAQGLSQQATLDMIQYIGGLPFLFGAVGGILTSVWSDWLVRRGMPALKARKTMMILMAFVAPLCILTPYVSEWQAVSFDARIGLVVAIFSLIAIMCLSWLYTICVVIAEAFPVKNVASVVGITAGAGAVGGAVFNIFIGSLLATMGNVLFAVMGVMHLVTAVILWRMVRHETPKNVK